MAAARPALVLPLRKSNKIKSMERETGEDKDKLHQSTSPIPRVVCRSVVVIAHVISLSGFQSLTRKARPTTRHYSLGC